MSGGGPSSDRASATGPVQLGGRRLGEWVVGDPIGSGGFADVYLARQPRLERDAVIKVLRVSDSNPRRVRLFEREARLACQLDHPYAAHVYSFGVETDGLLWIAMELVRGKSLSDVIRDDGPMPLTRFAPLFERLCEVVHSAHEVGLIHRDIKPANVMVVTRSGRLLPKLLDFGIAELIGASPPPPAEPASPIDDDTGSVDIEITETSRATNIEDGWTLDETSELGSDTMIADTMTASSPPMMVGAARRLAGTPPYMAPELWSGAEITQRTDVYSLGILAHQCLTGKLPFRASSARQYFDLHSNAKPPRLGSEFPTKLADALDAALAKDSADRLASALEFGKAVIEAMDLDAHRLSRADAAPWLLSAPGHLGDSLAHFEARRGVDANLALGDLLHALAQWIGVLALAASAKMGPRTVPGLGPLRTQRPTHRQWLEIGALVCEAYFERPEDFPIPELARWLADGAGGDQLLALATIAEREPGADPNPTTIGLLRGVLSSLQFLCDYQLGDDDSGDLLLQDGEGVGLLSLAPLAERATPSPGARGELFAFAGSPDGAPILSAPPRGFELGSELIGPWLEQHFGLARAAERLIEESDRGLYRGLAAFTADDSGIFFGRNRDVQTLFNRTLEQPFVALTGPSGSGKSSIIAAGLVPRLPENWAVATLRPGSDPVAALEAALQACGFGSGPDGEDAGRRLLVVVDQAEEVVTLADRSRADAFARQLVGLLDGDRVRVILSIRDDFISDASQIEAWRAPLSAGLLLVSTPTRGELYNMLVGPARRAGFEFSDERLPNEMVDAVVDEKAALPLLSFSAQQLWRARDRDRHLLTRDAYEEMGAVAGALARYAESVLAALPTARQGQVRALFRRLVTNEQTRAVVATSELATSADKRQILEHLVEARLLVVAESESGQDQVSIIHEALLTEWPRLARWCAEDSEAVRLRAEMTSAAATWRENDGDSSYLWRGAALANLESFIESSDVELSDKERAFTDASRAAQRRGTRRRRALLATAAFLLVGALVVLAIFNHRSEQNRIKAETQLTDMLASRGFGELAADRAMRSLVFLNAAYERGRDDRPMRVALGLALSRVGKVVDRTQAHDGAVRRIVTGNDALLLTASSPEPTKLWQWRDGQLHQIGEFEQPDVLSARISADGKHVVTQGIQSLRFWKADGTLITEARQPRRAHVLGLLPDGKHVASSNKEQLLVWDFAGNRKVEIGELRRHADIFDFKLSKDGERLALSLSDGRVEIWDYRKRTRLHAVEVGLGARAIVFAGSTGKRLLVTLSDGRVVLLDTARGTIIADRRFVDGHVDISVTRDGDRAVVFGKTDTLSVIETKTLKTLGTIQVTSGRAAAEFSADSKRLYVGDGTKVRVIDTATYDQVGVTDTGHANMAAAHIRGTPLVSFGGADGQLVTYDVGGRSAVTVFREHVGAPMRRGLINTAWSAQFSPDGSEILSFDNDAMLLWAPDSGEVRKRIPLLLFQPNGMPEARFSSDGQTILAPNRLQATTFDRATGLATARYGSESNLRATGFSDAYVATATMSNTDSQAYLSIWDRASEELIAERRHPDHPVDVAFSPTHPTVLYYCGPSQVGRWDFATGELSWSTSHVECGDFDLSADGRLLAADSHDGYINVWNANAGSIHRRLRAPTRVSFGAALSDSGELLAVGSLDQGITLWDVERGAVIGTLTGHDKRVRSLDFSPDERRLVSVDIGSKILVWPLEPETRSAAELGAFIRERVPLRLDGVEVVPAKAPR